MEETFTDPIVRCCDCQRLITREEIGKFGMCPGCGTKRVKNVQILTEKEVEALKDMGISEDFFKLFEEVDGE